MRVDNVASNIFQALVEGAVELCPGAGRHRLVRQERLDLTRSRTGRFIDRRRPFLDGEECEWRPVGWGGGKIGRRAFSFSLSRLLLARCCLETDCSACIRRHQVLALAPVEISLK